MLFPIVKRIFPDPSMSVNHNNGYTGFTFPATFLEYFPSGIKLKKKKDKAIGSHCEYIDIYMRKGILAGYRGPSNRQPEEEKEAEDHGQMTGQPQSLPFQA